MSKRTRRQVYGQHFLKDESLIEKIVFDSLSLFREQQCRSWLEIGPGHGALTVSLQKNMAPGETLTLVEKDKRLIEKLQGVFPNAVRMLEGDFLEVDPSVWLQDRLGVVSNLPYSSGTAILLELSKYYQKIPVMILMFQAEVAQRIRAKPDTKAWGSLSLSIQNHWEARTLCLVPPKAFIPPPQVNSEVLILKSLKEPRVLDSARTPEHQDLWQELIKTAFLHRRKMLRGVFIKNSKLAQALEASGIDPTLRAEALSWTDWAVFYREFLTACGVK